MSRLQSIARSAAGLATSRPAIRLLVTSTLVALCVFSALLVFGFQRSAAEVDQAEWKSERQMAGNYLRHLGENITAQVAVQMTWDDAFKAIGAGVDAQWADVYVGNFFANTLQHDFLLLVSPDGRPLRAWSHGTLVNNADLGALPGEIRAVMPLLATGASVHRNAASHRRLADTSWPFDGEGRPLTRWVAGFLRSDGKTAHVTITSVLPDGDFAALKRAPNYLVVVQHVDQAFLARMGHTLLFDAPTFGMARREGNMTNALALEAMPGGKAGWIGWRSVPLNQMLRAKIKPLFILYLGFLALVIAGGTAILSVLWRTMRNLSVSEARAQHVALHDSMTGLPNRAHFMQVLKTKLDTPEAREALVRVNVVYFDIDHFKMINDTMGHHVGDQLVRQVAQRLREESRPGDLLARLGGDEFVLMRSTPNDEADSISIGGDLARIVAPPFDIFGNAIRLTISTGISWAPEHGFDGGELLRNADIAMYRAKQRGRARARVFTREMDASVRWRREVEVELRHAIADDALTVAYQPIVSAATGRIEGLEALLRWNHPERGAIGPGVFIPVAEQSGLMVPLGWWVLRRVLCDCKAWPDLEISINLSPLQIMEHGFADLLQGLVDDLGADPLQVTFEVTEGVLLDSSTKVLAVLDRVKAMGFRIALDDFGTGYSSLSYLRSFHFDRIKIDSSFIQNIENDLDGQAILQAIASLGRSLRMKIVAEGVETLLQRQLVIAAGCHSIQGHFYWPALTPGQIDELLARARAGVRPSRAALPEAMKKGRPDRSGRPLGNRLAVAQAL